MKYFKKAYKHCLLLIFFIIFFFSVYSQTNTATVLKLNTTGLTNEDLFSNIFSGDFAVVELDRDDPGFSLLLDYYINTYSEKCGNSLPADKVEITYQECSRWVEHRTTGYFGTTVRNDCLEWKTDHTGEYTTPAMFKAKTTIDALQASDDLRNVFILLKQNNPIGVAQNYVKIAAVLNQDMNSFFSMNNCNSAGMKRFEQNLYNFAIGKLPIVLEGSKIPHADPNLALKDQDFDKLLDELISTQSAKWAINKYVPNSVSFASIISTDNEGRPDKVKANYEYYYLGSQKIDGSVTLTFINGLPNCLYFDDNPLVGRAASWKIMLKYAYGSYPLYSVDKSQADWKVTFNALGTINLHSANNPYGMSGTDPKKKEIFTLKAGDWIEWLTKDENGFDKMEALKGLDRRTSEDIDKSNHLLDNTAYTIDKIKNPDFWTINFKKTTILRVQPRGELFIVSPDMVEDPNTGAMVKVPPSIILKSGEWVEMEKSDGSFIVLKDLDRR